MKILKISFVVNQSIYLLIAVALISMYLNHRHFLLIALIIIYLIFLINRSLKLFLFIVLLIGIMIVIYRYHYKHLYELDKSTFISCRIDTIPEYKSDYVQFYCKNTRNHVLVYLKNTEKNLKIGDNIQMINNLELVKSNTIPYQFNYAKYLQAKHIAYQNRIDDLEIINRNRLINYELINHLIDYYEDSVISDYLLSFIIGNKNAFDDHFTTKAQTLNISHLFVVSGFHVGFLYLFFKSLFKHLKLTIEMSERFIAILLILFLVLNNFSISVFRAVLLILGIQVKNHYRLPIENINLLSLVAVINIIINPFILNHTGFILSYLITFILFLSHTVFSNFKHFFINFIKINLVAQLFSLPIVANFDFSYNFLSFLITPIISLYYTFVIFPLTILCLIIKPLDEVVEYFFRFFEFCLYQVASFSFFDINIGCFTIFRFMLYYYFLFQLMKKLEKKQLSYLYGTLLLVVMLIYHQLTFTDEVIFFDVGQGDSILIRSDLNHCNALIDTGGSLYYEPGQMVASYLKSIQMKQLDILFITHSDIDHANDYHIIINTFKVKTIIFSYYDQSELQMEK